MNETRANRAKHTTGPWEAFPPIGGGHWSVLSKHVNDGGNFHVATIQPGGEGIPAESAAADARVIAAAPEMREACKRILAFTASEDYDWKKTIAEIKNAARAALAKAEG